MFNINQKQKSMRKTSCFKRRFMTKALILSIVLVIVWGSSSIVGASPRVDKQLGQLITLTMKETSVINIIQEIRKSTDYRFLFQVDDLKNMNKEELEKIKAKAVKNQNFQELQHDEKIDSKFIK